MSENELKPGSSTNLSEETIPDEAKPIIEKIESQIESIVKGFNQVLQDKGVPEATIGDFQYIIEIPIPQAPNPIPKPPKDSRLEENSPDSGDGVMTTKIRFTGKLCPKVINGKKIWVPC